MLLNFHHSTTAGKKKRVGRKGYLLVDAIPNDFPLTENQRDYSQHGSQQSTRD